MGNTPIITNILQVTSKDGSDLDWSRYDIGAKGSNIAIFNRDGSLYNLQGAVSTLLPTRTFIYGNPIWDNENETTEELTWSNIQKWLDEDRITNFLKEGDCIKIKVKEPGDTEDCYWHIWVIGINTYNGQVQDEVNIATGTQRKRDLGTPHIDFCGGSYAKGITSSIDTSYYAPDELTETFFEIFSNNGESSPSHFLKTSKINILNEGMLPSISNTETNNILNKLKMNKTQPAYKQLIVENRPGPLMSPFLQLWCDDVNQVYGVGSITKDTILTALEKIAQRLKNQQSNPRFKELRPLWQYREITRLLLGYDPNCPYELYHFSSASALYMMRFSVGLEDDPLLKMLEEEYKVFNSAFALDLLRNSVDLDPIVKTMGTTFPTNFPWGLMCNQNTTANSVIAGALWDSHTDENCVQYDITFDPDVYIDDGSIDMENFSMTVANNTSDKRNKFSAYFWDSYVQAVLNGGDKTFSWTSNDNLHYSIVGFAELILLLSYFVNYAFENGGIKRKNAVSYEEKNQENLPLYTTLNYKLWGLTEIELFGQVTYGHVIDSFGDGFSYPILNHPYYRRCIQYDLHGGKPRLTSRGVSAKCVTITAAENSTTDVVGIGNSLEPTCYNAVDPKLQRAGNSFRYDNNIDMPICFRFQRAKTKQEEIDELDNS